MNAFEIKKNRIEKSWASIAGSNSKHFITVFVLIILGLFLDATIEYRENGPSIQVAIDYTHSFIAAIILLLVCRNILSKTKGLTIIIYSIVFSMLVSFLFRLDSPDLVFETFFLKFELLFTILTFAIGLFVLPIHMLFMFIINSIFIGLCIYFYSEVYPISKFIFYGILVGGAGIIGYRVHSIYLEMTKRVNSANELITHRNTELQAINESKDDLFQIIGHDLKTPFAQLISLVEIMDSLEDPEDKKTVKKMIIESAFNGNELLNSLLSWTKSIEQVPNKEKKKIQLRLMVEKSALLLSTNYKSKQIKLINNIEADKYLFCDQNMIETVLRNLLSNAIKYSLDQSSIVVDCREQENTIKIFIKDSGIGMNQNTIEKIIQDQKLKSAAGTLNEIGSGLGLRISRKMIEKHDGSIEFKSKIGEGTTVILKFPILPSQN